MDDKNKRKDLIIKLILVIVIILLLIHNCSLLKKKGKDKVPSGNVNIIEITCEDNNKCDIKPKDKDDDTNSEVSDDVDVSNNGGTSKNNGASNNKTTSDNNGSNNNSSSTGGETSNTDDDSDDEEEFDDIVEPEDEMFVRDKKLVWNDTSPVKIFTNSVYTFEDKIAPEVSNTYQFVVKNSTSYNLKYNISFMETNPYHINMRYKLKKNNSYVIDHYVSYNELIVNEQLLDAKSNDTYYLEWKWVSSDNDNDAGENGANYSLEIKVEAESTND